jgi:uncharacterized protein (DUF433 family)
MISTNPGVMRGQAVIAGTCVPVSVILDCPATGMTAEEITADFPTVTVAGVRAAAAMAPHWRASTCFRCRSRGDVRARPEPAPVGACGLR